MSDQDRRRYRGLITRRLPQGLLGFARRWLNR